MAFQTAQPRPLATRQSNQKWREDAPTITTNPIVEDETKHWILFAPLSQPETSLTPQTADISHLSNLDSFDNCLVTERSDDQQDVEDLFTDGGTDLDSLDDGLYAFQNPEPGLFEQNIDTLLPRHDGRGSFMINDAEGEAIQQRLWQYEKYNLQRQVEDKHVNANISLDQRPEHLRAEVDQEEKRSRVERWRMEQSKAVLEELERESERLRTRRREQDVANAVRESQSINNENDGRSISHVEKEEEPESFLQRITQKVLQNLLGLDLEALNVIFGEELANEDRDTMNLPDIDDIDFDGQETDISNPLYSHRLLNRIAREVGDLVIEMSGLEGSLNTHQRDDNHSFALDSQQRSRQPHTTKTVHTTSNNPQNSQTFTDKSRHTLTEAEERDYWERDPSLRMVFSYFRNRFRNRKHIHAVESTPESGPLPASWASSIPPIDSEHRADLIRRTHPLIERRKDFSTAAVKKHRSELAAIGNALRRRGSSACGGNGSVHSKSTWRSNKKSSDHASRRYWDFSAGSISGRSISGTMVESSVGVGVVGGSAWGEA